MIEASKVDHSASYAVGCCWLLAAVFVSAASTLHLGAFEAGEQGQKAHLYHGARPPFGEWDVPRGVTQAGMPQRKIINRHPVVLLVA